MYFSTESDRSVLYLFNLTDIKHRFSSSFVRCNGLVSPLTHLVVRAHVFEFQLFVPGNLRYSGSVLRARVVATVFGNENRTLVFTLNLIWFD